MDLQCVNGFYYFDYNIRMGNSSRNPEDYDIVRNYRRQDWQLSSANSTPQLWRNRKTHQVAEIYRLYSIPSIQDMNRYEIRSTQQNFVKVYHIALSPDRAMCFNEQYVRLLIEYIPVKLQNVSGLELEQALTILVAAFKGFNTLSNNFGLVEPHQELIGFNQWGKAKVWLNKQHGNNFPPQSLPINFDKSRVEASHVRKIFDLIERKTQTGQLPIALKQLFRFNNPNYLQAILIVQQFGYQNQLSLQRFIRTDLYTRKSSIYGSNISVLDRQGQSRQIRGSSNEKCNANFVNPMQNFPRPQLKRMYSVDALHTQRVMNHSQSSVSIATMQFKQNLNHHSGIYFTHQNHQSVNSSIPRIHFQKSSQPRFCMPFVNQAINSNRNYPIQIKTPLFKENVEHVKCISILSPHQSTPSPQKVQLIQVKKLSRFAEESEPSSPLQHQQLISAQREELKQIKSNELSLQIQQVKIYSNINITANQESIVNGPETCRSIIDKVDCEVKSEEQGEVDRQEDPIQYQLRQQEQIQVSGTFNYKALYEKDPVQHFHHPLEQIEEDDYSKEKQYEDDSKIKSQDEEFQQNVTNQQAKHTQIFQNSSHNIPINFQSFAPAKLLQNQLVSFAPNQISFPTQQSIQSEENVQTSKSFQYEQNCKNKQKGDRIQSIQQLQIKINEESHQPDIKPYKQEIVKVKQPQNYQEMVHLLQARKRVSIDLYYPQASGNPFYAHCTPVQSKFDVVVKRDSSISQESSRHERPSAFAHLDTDQEIENYVRNKYLGSKNANTYQQKFKVGRVESQYEKHYVKQPETYDFAKKQLPKKQNERQNNRSHLRQQNNKISNIMEKPQEDFLDVNFLEKSLDKRYSANIKKTLKQKQEEDELNIAKLDEGLMKFSTSKASLTEKSSKDDKYFDPIQPKADIKIFNQYLSKWQTSTGFQYQSKGKQAIQPVDTKKKKKSVRIDNVPTHQFNYQLTCSDGTFKGYTKQISKSPFKQTSPYSNENTSKYGSNYNDSKISKITQNQKKSIDDRYNKYVKNSSSKIGKLPKTPSINQILGKGQSRLMLSPIPEKRWEDEGRLSYDQLRSFLWG